MEFTCRSLSVDMLALAGRRAVQGQLDLFILHFKSVSQSVSQLVSQSVSQSVNNGISSQSMMAFRTCSFFVLTNTE